MKYDFEKKMMEINGKVAKERDGKAFKMSTLLRSVLNVYRPEKEVRTPEFAGDVYRIIEGLRSGKEVELSSEQVTIIKQALAASNIGNDYYGQVEKVLEKKEEGKKKPKKK